MHALRLQIFIAIIAWIAGACWGHHFSASAIFCALFLAQRAYSSDKAKKGATDAVKIRKLRLMLFVRCTLGLACGASLMQTPTNPDGVQFSLVTLGLFVATWAPRGDEAKFETTQTLAGVACWAALVAGVIIAFHQRRMPDPENSAHLNLIDRTSWADQGVNVGELIYRFLVQWVWTVLFFLPILSMMALVEAAAPKPSDAPGSKLCWSLRCLKAVPWVWLLVALVLILGGQFFSSRFDPISRVLPLLAVAITATVPFLLIMKVRYSIATKPSSSFYKWAYEPSPVAWTLSKTMLILRVCSPLQWLKFIFRHVRSDVQTTNQSGRKDIPPRLTEFYWIASACVLGVVVLVLPMDRLSEILTIHPNFVRLVALTIYVEAVVWVLYYNFLRLFMEDAERYTIYHRLEYLVLHPVLWFVQLTSTVLLFSTYHGPQYGPLPSRPPLFLLEIYFRGSEQEIFWFAFQTSLTSFLMLTVVMAYLVNGLPQPRTKESHGLRRGLTIIGAGDVVANKLLPAVKEHWGADSAQKGPIRVVADTAPQRSRADDPFKDVLLDLCDGTEPFGDSVDTPVFVATPTRHHLRAAQEAVKRLHFCAVEKPMAAPYDLEEMGKLLKQPAASRLFFLSYYILEKGLPLTLLLLELWRYKCDKTGNGESSAEKQERLSERKRLDEIINTLGHFVGRKSGEGCAGETRDQTMRDWLKDATLERWKITIHEDASKSPRGFGNRVWTEVDPVGEGTEPHQNGGTLFETFSHVFVLDRLCRKAISEAGQEQAEYSFIFKRSAKRFCELAKHMEKQLIKPGERAAAGFYKMHATSIEATSKKNDKSPPTATLSVKKFATESERKATLHFSKNGAPLQVEMDFEKKELKLPVGNDHVYFVASYETNYRTLIALFLLFVKRGGFDGGVRWDLADVQLEALQTLKQWMGPSLDDGAFE